MSRRDSTPMNSEWETEEAVIEELRRDMPTVRNRVDEEADAFQSPVDPHAVMNRLEATMGSRPPEEAEKIGEED